MKLQRADQQVQLARNDTARNALPDMTTVQTKARTVRGGNEIKLSEPVATFILEDHPRFAWMLAEPPPNLTGYKLMIDGGNSRSFTKTLPKDAIEWDTKSEPVSQFEPLARGKVYHWQVQAITSDGSESPRSPIAAFKVVPADVKARIAHAQRRYANRPDLLATAYMQAGLIEDAQRTLNDWKNNPKAAQKAP